MRRFTSLVIASIATGLLLAGIAVSAGASGQKPTDQETQILTQYQQQHGYIPKALKMMSARGQVLGGFMTYGKAIFDGGPLDDRERSLVALSAAVALKSPECIAAHSDRARKAGAGDDEIAQTILIAGMLSNTSALHVAYSAATSPVN